MLLANGIEGSLSGWMGQQGCSAKDNKMLQAEKGPSLPKTSMRDMLYVLFRLLGSQNFVNQLVGWLD